MKTMMMNKVDKLEYSEREQLNTISSNLIFSGKNIKTVLVTSTNANEGKSYVGFQLLMNMAVRGKKSVLLDVDLRRSNLIASHQMETDVKPIVGLAHYLSGQCAIDDIIYQTNVDNMYVIPIGRDVANPVPLLNSSNLEHLMAYLREQFDFILMDTPPIGLVVDAAEITRYCDGVVFIVAHARTRRKDFRTSMQQIKNTGCPILGCIMNKVSFKRVSYRRYYNKYYYANYYSKYYRDASASSKKKKDAADKG